MIKCILVISFTLISKLTFGQEKLDVFDIARKGTVEMASEQIKANPNAFNVVNAEGFSPLTLACYRNNNAVAKYIIEHGGNVNGNSNLGTPLMAAVVKGNKEIAVQLLEHKANVNDQDANGMNALLYAVQFQNIEIVKLLLQYHADKSHRDKQGKTAFEYAVFSNNETIINLLK